MKTGMDLGVQKKNRIIFRGRGVMYVKSGKALKAWKILDFELPTNFNLGILATKTTLKHIQASIYLLKVNNRH